MTDSIRQDGKEPIVDGRFRLKISRDKLQVYFDELTAPSGGGKPVALNQVLAKIKKLEVEHGVDNKKIAAILTALAEGRLSSGTDTATSTDTNPDDQEKIHPLCFAMGDPPTHGSNGLLIWHIDEKILNAGNYAALPGEHIATYNPPTKGEDGKSVLGKTIRAQPGRDETSKPGEGIETHKEGEQIEYRAKWPGIIQLNNTSLAIPCPIRIADDKMSAVIDLYPPSAVAQTLTLENVVSSLNSIGIQHGIAEPDLNKALKTLCETGQPIKGVVVAKGTPVTQGTDSNIEWNMDLENKPATARVALANTLIATRRPVTTGTHGKNILGTEIPAIPGENEHDIRIGSYIEETQVKAGYECRAQILGVVKVNTDSSPAVLSVDPTIIISEDAMEARMDLFSHTAGDEAIKLGDVLTSLRVCGVQYGIDNDTIKQMIEKLTSQGKAAHIEGVVIAKGKPKVDGGDAHVIFTQQEQTAGLKLSGGRIDFHERNYPWNVKKGDVIGKVVKSTPKTDGMTVTGLTIEAKEAEEMKLNLTSISIDVVGNLSADIDGVLLIDGSNLSVAEVLVTNGDVDNKTGNINSDSPVHVKGHVEPGFKIECAKEVIIEKNVEDAVVHAGAGIVIKGGIRGRKSEVFAPGNLNVGFVENAVIFVSGDVMIGESTINSEVTSNSSITVGSKKARHSAVMGGILTAKTSIEAVELGSNAHVKTLVRVGLSQEMRKQLRSLKAELETKTDGVIQLNQLEARYRSKPTNQSADVILKVTATRDVILGEIESLKKALSKLEEETEKASDAKIVVSKHIYPGVTISINEHILDIKDEMGAGSFSFNGNEVVFHPA